MSLRPLEIFLLLQCGDRLESSESDVYKRQIMSTKVDPRAVDLTLCPQWVFLPPPSPISPLPPPSLLSSEEVTQQVFGRRCLVDD